MRAFLTLIILVLIVGLSYFIVSLLFTQSLEDQVQSSDDPNSSNSAGNVNVTPINPGSEPAKIQLETLYGQTLTVNNFKNIEKVLSVGAGMYTLDPGLGYQIIFNENNSSFAVNITKKPVLNTRDQAVFALADALDVPVTDLCLLNIYVSTTYDFDPATSGTNLGIDICVN